MHTQPSTGGEGGRAETNGREEEESVEREEFALTLEKTEGGVCLRVSGGCRGDAQVRRARTRFTFVSVVACCSGYRRRDIHYADLLYFYTTTSTTLYLRSTAISPYLPCRLTSLSASGCTLWSCWGALRGCERGCRECMRGGKRFEGLVVL